MKVIMMMLFLHLGILSAYSTGNIHIKRAIDYDIFQKLNSKLFLLYMTTSQPVVEYTSEIFSRTMVMMEPNPGGTDGLTGRTNSKRYQHDNL